MYGSNNYQQQHQHQFQQHQQPQQQQDQEDTHNITQEMNMIQMQGGINNDDMQINQILVNLKQKRTKIQNLHQIKLSEREGIIEDITILSQRLKALIKSIDRKRTLYDQFDQTLQESQHAFNKISESTRTLLDVVNKEHVALKKQQQYNSIEFQHDQQ